MATTVPRGFYYGFTAAELEAEKVRLKQSRVNWTSMLADGQVVTAGTLNGSQVTLANMSQVKAHCDAWQAEIINAEAMLAGTALTGGTNRKVAGMRY